MHDITFTESAEKLREEDNRDFYRELDFFLEMLKTRENFALTRFGDGEFMIIDGHFLDLRDKKNGEFRFDPKMEIYDIPRQKLTASFKYKHKRYYVGVPCLCCVGSDSHLKMKRRSEQPENNLTWANLFVNANYTRLLADLPVALSEREVILVGHKDMDTSQIRFPIEEVFHVGADAWVNDYALVSELKNKVIREKWKDKVVLIMAGPLANIMAYELFAFNQNNTFIDLGSCLDVILSLRATRNYQVGGEHIARKCIW